MSIKAMQYVFENKTTKGSQRLMLLAIADRCDDEGVCYPGVNKLAEKCNVKRRQAINLIQDLERLGEIRVSEGQGVTTKGGSTNRYYMTGYMKANDLPVDETLFRDVEPKKTRQKSKVVQPVTPSSLKEPSATSDKNPVQHSTNPVQHLTEVVQQVTPNTKIDTKIDTKIENPLPTIVGSEVKNFDAKDNAFLLQQIISEKLVLPATEWNIAHMLSGTAVKQQPYKAIAEKHFADNPVTPAEFKNFLEWYSLKNQGCDLVSPNTFLNWIAKYRKEHEKQAAPIIVVGEARTSQWRATL